MGTSLGITPAIATGVSLIAMHAWHSGGIATKQCHATDQILTVLNSLDHVAVVVDLDGTVPGHGDAGFPHGQGSTMVGQQQGVVAQHQVRRQQVRTLGLVGNCATCLTVVEKHSGQVAD